MQILIHTVRMARIVHIGQKVENFQLKVLLSASVQFYKRDNDSTSVEKAQVRISYKLNERLKYYEITFRCIHGDKNLVSRDIAKYTPLKPHIYIAKLGYAGVYLFFLFLLQNIDCGYSLEPSHLSEELLLF